MNNIECHYINYDLKSKNQKNIYSYINKYDNTATFNLVEIKNKMCYFVDNYIEVLEIKRLVDHFHLWKQCVSSKKIFCIIENKISDNFYKLLPNLFDQKDNIDAINENSWDIIFIGLNNEESDNSSFPISLKESYIKHIIKNTIENISDINGVITINIKPTNESYGYIIHPNFAQKLIDIINKYGFFLPLNKLFIALHNFIEIRSFISIINLINTDIISYKDSYKRLIYIFRQRNITEFTYTSIKPSNPKIQINSILFPYKNTDFKYKNIEDIYTSINIELAVNINLDNNEKFIKNSGIGVVQDIDCIFQDRDNLKIYDTYTINNSLLDRDDMKSIDTINSYEPSENIDIFSNNTKEYNTYKIPFSQKNDFINKIISHIDPNKNIIDIGTNTGIETIIYSKNTQKNVFAFEFHHFDILEKNIKEEKCLSVIIHKVILSDKCEKIGDHKFEEEIIETKKLDNFNIENVGLIKIDVDHTEKSEKLEKLEKCQVYKPNISHIFVGAMKTIEKYKPVIIYKQSFNESEIYFGCMNFNIINYLHSLNYTTKIFEEQNFIIAIPRGPIISLTTIPSRIKNINLTLDSLMNQTMIPQKIILIIPYKSLRFDSEYIIPNLSKYSLLEILKCDDIGPATKILPLIKIIKEQMTELTNTPILFVDDDRIYNNKFVENMYFSSIKNPNRIITGGTLHQYVTYFNGCNGCIVKANMFTEEVFNIPNKFRFIDDIWLSGHLIKNGYNIFCINIGDSERHTNDDINSLIDETNRRELNNECIKWYQNNFNIWND
jgi:hypothetical protein